jgi:predicted flap endonuclease-1-like 5' DNA nuclease
MEHLTFELVLWTLLAFFIGCVVGCLLRASLTRRRPASDDGTIDAAASSPVADEAAPTEVTALPETPVVVAEEASELAALDALRQPAAPPMPAEPAMPAEPGEVSPRAAEPRPEPVASSRPEPPPAGGRPKRPQGLAAPRNDRPDNLQRISGIGPKLEKTLQDLGFFHYDQIAAWDPMEVDWINEHLRFRGRVEREQWIEQARLLAEGREEQFAQVYGARVLRDDGNVGGGVRGRRGQGSGSS